MSEINGLCEKLCMQTDQSQTDRLLLIREKDRVHILIEHLKVEAQLWETYLHMYSYSSSSPD